MTSETRTDGVTLVRRLNAIETKIESLWVELDAAITDIESKYTVCEYSPYPPYTCSNNAWRGVKEDG